jgi:hypothetical protein
MVRTFQAPSSRVLTVSTENSTRYTRTALLLPSSSSRTNKRGTEALGVDDGSDKNKSKGRIMAKGEDKGHRFGVCVLDCATSQCN